MGIGIGIGIGLAFISICSLAALIYLAQLNTIVRHLALDPVLVSAPIGLWPESIRHR